MRLPQIFPFCLRARQQKQAECQNMIAFFGTVIANSQKRK